LAGWLGCHVFGWLAGLVASRVWLAGMMLVYWLIGEVAVTDWLRFVL
jgi:hypothetical protein